MKHPDRTIIKLSGPTAYATGMGDAFMHEVVIVGSEALIGEIIRLERGVATIQMFEETSGLTIGDPVTRTGEQLSVELGPGLLGSIYDGVARPLPALAAAFGDFMARGVTAPTLDRERKWAFNPTVAIGDTVTAGSIIGTVAETDQITHKIKIPPHAKQGVIATINKGTFTVDEPVGALEDGAPLSLFHRWPVHEARPFAKRLPLDIPLVTGQRILDTLFPIAEGGVAIIPGGFGSGKTVLEQALAKFSNAEIIVYVGCGERGNEMAGVLHEFPELTDPYSGRPLMERTILVANTSNMPVAAREASIYTGVTIAEYYRDMGYRVAVMADSTSRWAEALREISSQMEEMPGEEGYPTYLPSRIGAFYERAGRIVPLAGENQSGSVTIIGAASPPGGDFSEPVTQASLQVASTFWALDYDLAHQRHFPAINWLLSFSLTAERLLPWFTANVHTRFPQLRTRLDALLQREKELAEIIQIVGLDAMGDREQVEFEAARIIREGFLRQNSYHPVDGYCSLARQGKMMIALLDYIDALFVAIGHNVPIDKIIGAPMTEQYIRLQETPEAPIDKRIDTLKSETSRYFADIKGDDL